MARDRVLIVAVKRFGEKAIDVRETALEMTELVQSALGTVIEVVTANVPHPSAKYFVREGKVHEIYEEVIKTQTNVLIFSVDLTPVQVRNLEKDCGVRVVDRTGLILDIFARRAVSADGKLQVELAQMEYLLPRLSGQGEAMSQQGGGIGTRGPGEQKLETDKRKIRKRISTIKERLEKLRVHRAQLRSGRRQKGLLQVAIVGYTNAGKSTLLNALTGANAYAENKLFATLDPKTRIYKDETGSNILFTDTVGFIRDLPHALVKAFHATLEESLEADLILIVLDASSERVMENKRVAENVLKELGAESKKTILVLNKIELLTDSEKLRVQDLFPNATSISAKERFGLKELIFVIKRSF